MNIPESPTDHVQTQKEEIMTTSSPLPENSATKIDKSTEKSGPSSPKHIKLAETSEISENVVPSTRIEPDKEPETVPKITEKYTDSPKEDETSENSEEKDDSSSLSEEMNLLEAQNEDDSRTTELDAELEREIENMDDDSNEKTSITDEEKVEKEKIEVVLENDERVDVLEEIDKILENNEEDSNEKKPHTKEETPMEVDKKENIKSDNEISLMKGNSVNGISKMGRGFSRTFNSIILPSNRNFD